jgi:hypothetical protein
VTGLLVVAVLAAGAALFVPWPLGGLLSLAAILTVGALLVRAR